MLNIFHASMEKSGSPRRGAQSGAQFHHDFVAVPLVPPLVEVVRPDAGADLDSSLDDLIEFGARCAFQCPLRSNIGFWYRRSKGFFSTGVLTCIFGTRP